MQQPWQLYNVLKLLYHRHSLAETVHCCILCKACNVHGHAKRWTQQNIQQCSSQEPSSRASSVNYPSPVNTFSSPLQCGREEDVLSTCKNPMVAPASPRLANSLSLALHCGCCVDIGDVWAKDVTHARPVALLTRLKVATMVLVRLVPAHHGTCRITRRY